MRKQGLIHDIMNISTTIENRISLLKILQENENINGRIKENIEILNEKMPLFIDLLRQLRNEIYCETVSDKVSFIDINDIINTFVKIINDYPVRYKIEKDDVFSRKGIYINRTNLERILTNLIANAVEASISTKIWYKLFETDTIEEKCFFCQKEIPKHNEKFFCVSISNTGSFYCDHFVERFSTKDNGYSGFGLMIVNELLHQTNAHMVLKKDHPKKEVKAILVFP